MNKKKINIDGIGNDELQVLFEETFQEKVASINNIQDFDVTVTRDLNNKKIIFEATIIGLAGTPSIDDFRGGKVKNSTSLKISRPDKGSLELRLLPSKTAFLSGNDYIVVYESV